MSRHLFGTCHLTLLLVAFWTAAAVAQRNLTKIPDVDPAVEQKSFVLSDQLQSNLYAGDPEIAKPIQINFDGQGRLWVAGSEVYPHIKPGQQANDKILVLEDTDHDGVIDKKTVFADGLLIPTGVLPDENGGCYVANSTELLYFADSDGDGVADRREVVLSGFGTEDTHHLLHTLRWAPDGSLFMNQSIYIHSHIETPRGVRHLNGGGLWRFRPDTLQLEVYCKGFVNPWGTHFDRWGQTFVTDGAYGEGINYAFPDSVFVSSPGARRTMSGLNPGSPKHCSLEIISGDHFPADWQGNMITNDFRANRVCRFLVTDDGTGYQSRQATEVIRSDFVAFRPIDAKLGPDGALYIADWYNPIIQHGEVDFRDPRRDHVHGRVWRVTMENRPLSTRPNFSQMDASQLLTHLQDSHADVRLWAKRYLRRLPQNKVLSAIQEAIAKLPPDRTESTEHLRLELLWAGLNLDSLNRELLNQLLESPVDSARAAAVRIASNFIRPESPQQMLTIADSLIHDPSSHVRLEVVCALGRTPDPAAAAIAMQALDLPIDRNLDFALWQALRQLSPQWLPLVQAGNWDYQPSPSHLIFALKATDSTDVVGPMLQMLRSGNITDAAVHSVLQQTAPMADDAQLSQLAAWIDDQPDGIAQKIERWGILAAPSKAAPRELPLQLQSSLESLGSSSSASNLLKVISGWKLKTYADRVQNLAGDTTSETELRQQAIVTLCDLGSNPDDVSTITFLESLANDPEIPEAIGITAASQMARLDVARAAGLVAVRLQTWPENQPTQHMTQVLLSQQGGQTALQEALKTSQLPVGVARELLADVRASAKPSDALIGQIRLSGNLENAGWKFNADQLASFLEEVQQEGDPHQGERIYRRPALQCVNCHAIGGVGNEVGPDMISIGASAPVDYLVDSLIDPNAKIKEGYHSKLVQTLDGKIISGIVTSQANGVTTLRLADNTLVTIDEQEIDQIADGKSLMPEGLIDTLTRQELRDLVSFLSKLGKEAPFAIRGEPVARAWQVMPWNEAAHRRLNRTSFDTIASDDPALVWQDILPLVSGAVVVGELPTYKIHANVPETTFLRTPFRMENPATVSVQLSTTNGIQMWVDRDPAVVGEQMTFDLEPGTHWLYFAVEKPADRTPLQVQITSAADETSAVELPRKIRALTQTP